MKHFLTALQWDLIRQTRYNIIGIAILVTVLYVLLIVNIKWEYLDKLVIILIFNDPAAMGMMFIGSLVLFEKSDRSLEALAVTPLKSWQYLFAKAFSLTLVALGCSYVMAFAGFGWSFNYLLFGLAVGITSFLFVFLGFYVVSGCQSFNGYIMKLALWLLPVIFPLLNFIEVSDSQLAYLIPVQGAFILLEAAFGKVTSLWEYVYAFSYLLICTLVAFYFAQKAFREKLIV